MQTIKKYYKLIKVVNSPDPLYLENTYSGSNTFTIGKTGSPTAKNIEYSLDNETWTQFTISGTTATVTVPQGGRIYLRSTNGFSDSISNYYYVTMSQSHNAGGQIDSIFDYRLMGGITSTSGYCCAWMFTKDAELIRCDISMGNITQIGESTFFGFLFLNPGTSKVVSAPDMTKITSVAATGCNAMFGNCVALPSVTGFNNLVSVDSGGMMNCFAGCSIMTKSPDFSKVTTISGNQPFAETFNRCSALVDVTAPNLQSWDTSKFNNWLSNTPASGVVRKPTGLSIPSGSSGVPVGWTTADY